MKTGAPNLQAETSNTPEGMSVESKHLLAGFIVALAKKYSSALNS